MAFDATTIDTAVKAALGAADVLPPDKKGAIVGSADKDGAKLIVLSRIGSSKHWQIAGVLDHPWTGGLTAEALVVATW